MAARAEAQPQPYRADWKRGGVTSWLTTVDHKRIGILYVVTSLFFFFLGGLLSLFMRAQLATPNEHFVTRDRYNELFTVHGTTMVFLVVVPILAGFGNYIVPLMIGARDMAFPRLNAFSYWMFLLGGIVLYSSFFADGGPAKSGWTAYPPLSENPYSGGQRPGPLDPVAAPARRLLARGRDQLHRDDPQHARARHDLDAHAALRLVDRGLRLAAGRDPAGDRRRPPAAPARPAGRNAFLLTRARAATRCSTSTSSGSSGTPRSTS